MTKKGGKVDRVGTTDSGRTVILTYGEEPVSARRSKRHYQLWKLAESLTPEEIRVLITSRVKELKWTDNCKLYQEIKTDIKILEDSYKIIKRKKDMEEK